MVRQRVPFRLLLGVASLLLLLLLVTAGCQTAPSPESLPTNATQGALPQPTPTPAPASTPIEPAVPADDEGEAPAATLLAPVPGADPMVAAATADLARRLGVPEDEIVVKAVEAVEWSDGSLGCPRPGMSYIQVLTPGFRVILQVEGVEHEYHTDTR